MTMTASDLCGLILIDKPKGPTSMHVCRIVKKRLMNSGLPKSIKVGHGGTLDPLATGLLVVLVGKATRLCDLVMAGEKEYRTRIDLEHFSASCDLETRPEPAEVAGIPTRERVEEVLKEQFTGEIQQRPPVFSAMWVDGKRAYEHARKGRDVEMALRPVVIREIRIERYEWPTLELHVTCGKGTYIRSLSRDIGVALGTGGVMTGLRRTRIGTMRIEDATELDAMADPFPPRLLRELDPALMETLQKTRAERRMEKLDQMDQMDQDGSEDESV